MKIKHLLLVAIVLVASITSCMDDKKYTYESDSLKFNSTVAGQTSMSRAANSAWDVGDAIGVFMKKGTGLSTIVDEAANKKYTTATTLGTEFMPADPITQAIFFPKSGKVDFIAYYPYNEGLNDSYVYKVDVKNQASQEKIDLLYSNDATDKQSGDQVTLGFKHELTKVVFNLIATSANVDLTDAVVAIDGMPLTADFDLATGALTVTGDAGVATLKSTVDAASKQKAISEGIVIPTAKAARQFSFTFKNGSATVTHTWDASNEPFDKGMKNTYNVQLGAAAGVIVEPGSTIEPWGPGSSEDIVIDLDGDDTTTGNGTKENPFTVADAAKKVGTNNTWVTGYIVGSSSTARAIGTPSKDNIVLAATAGETDESKWIIVDLKESAVAAKLDIVANPELVGKQVKVQGNVVNNIFGGVLAMTAITAQEGGKEGENPGVEKEFFTETFGKGAKVSGKWAQIGIYEDYDNKAPVKFSDPYGTWADIRLSGTVANVWFPAHTDALAKESGLLIEGIEGGYSNITLSYDVAAQVANTDASVIVVKCNGVVVPVPAKVLEKTNTFETIEVSVPDNVTSLEFYSGAANVKAFRVANIRLKGTK